MEKITFVTRLLDKKQLTEDVFEFTLEKPKNFTYEAGQFIQIYIPNQEKKITRSYSLCSLPDYDTLCLTIKIIPEGIGSNYLKNLQIHDEIKISEASGNFLLKNTNDPAIFFATGVGIAPILPMIQTFVKNNTLTPVQLVFGVRHEQDIFYKEILEKLKNEYTNFTYTITLSQHEEENEYIQGRVTEHVASLIQGNANYYFCGSPAMILDIRKILVQNNIPLSQIHFEMF
ncbi:MAG: FAD-dependent oxidoreductase [Candidatus Magasanikbacteria bacterium]